MQQIILYFFKNQNNSVQKNPPKKWEILVSSPLRESNGATYRKKFDFHNRFRTADFGNVAPASPFPH